VDDLTPELVADALRDLMTGGALDAWVTPVHMKKGRPGFLISALCDPGLEPEMRAALFRATPTFGVRAYTVQRTELERRTVAVPLEGGDVRIKLGILDGEVVSATPEHDDVVALAHQADRAVREVYEEAAAAARHLRYEGAEPS
jgi:pyridinium-3,5-bisthiocarboxylic acid mononucleotide nickel chelatase